MKTKHTPGEWKYQPGTKTIRSKKENYWIATMDSWDGAVNNEANAKLIAAAPELLQMVYDLKQCIKRLTADNLTQSERDKEAEWEGEAHELLTVINPDYYKNANQI